MFICLCLFVGNSLNFSSLKVFHLHYHKIFCTEFIFKIWLFHFFKFWVNHSIMFWLSFFNISIICVAAGSLIIAPKKIIVFFFLVIHEIFSVFIFQQFYSAVPCNGVFITLWWVFLWSLGLKSTFSETLVIVYLYLLPLLSPDLNHCSFA